MKRLLAVPTFVLAVALLCLAIGSLTAPAQATAPTRIGVFDSRAIALAYWQSEAGMREAGAMRDEYAKAKAANDAKRVKELEQEGPWQQVRMHQQVFSTVTVATILEKVSDKLPALAKDARVTAIVSKWELSYKDASIETVDVTLPLVKLFNQDPRMLKMMDDIRAQAPIPFEKLALDPMM